MDESSSMFQTPKTFDEQKEFVINSVLKSTVYKNKWALQIFLEWQDSDALWPIVCGLKRFLVEKNGEDALNPLTVSDKRYHFNWFWKVLFVLCILTLCNLCCFFLQYRFGTFRTVIICELPNYSVTFFKRNKCLLFAWDIIYVELIYSCHMIFLEWVNIWIMYPNL